LRLKIIYNPLYDGRYYIPQLKFLWFWLDIQSVPFFNYKEAVRWLQSYKTDVLVTYEYF